MTRTATRLLRYLLCVSGFLSYSTADGADYLTGIKPLLQHKCYACHGALKQQAGLRLDTAAALIRGGDSGSPIVPGKPDQSLLLDVLTGAAGFRMPPDNEGAPLSAQEIARVREWIAAGAAQPDHETPQDDPNSWWSYRAIERPPVPATTHQDWCRNEIDAFIAVERDERGLPHTPDAPRALWLRRVFIDLIGLPPTRAELQQFLADESPHAMERIVDDLLSRPQYGERWGRHWMDVWRYSDWYGSRGINEIRYSQRHIWRWRDWIVNSLNADVGYDRMIREMLAADEVVHDDPARLAATGYLGRNWYKFDRDVWLFETVERTGEAFLGLTFRCCRCHDHKFDPITQEEYFRFRAIFEPHEVRTDRISALTATQKDATLGEVLNDGIALVFDKTVDAVTYRYERGDSRFPVESQPLTPGVPAALGGTLDVRSITLPVQTWYPLLRPGVRNTLIEQAEADVAAAEQSLVAVVRAATAAADQLAAAARQPESDTVPINLLNDDFAHTRPDVWQIVNGNWNYKDGNLVQSAVTGFATIVTKADIVGDFQIRLRYRTLNPGTYRSVGFSFDYLDQGNSQDIYTSTGNDRQSVQAFHRINGQQVYPPKGIVATPLRVDAETQLNVNVFGSRLTIDLNGQRRLDYVMPEKRRDGRFALWVHQGAAEFLELAITRQPNSLETLERRNVEAGRNVTIARAERNVAQGAVTAIRNRIDAEVAKHIDNDAASADQLASAARAAELHLAVLKARRDVAATDGSPGKTAEAETALTAAIAAATNPTGEYTPIGEQYPRISTGRRAALADWLASRDNPRTARVAANHIWGRHFGQPLVATPENFGLNGRQPTHPQLLDWLAAELIANDWQMKPLHKQLVLSATYRMATAPEIVPGIARIANDSPSGSGFHDALKSDPDNHYLWRMNTRRMEAEVVRDAILHLAARLDVTIGGPEIAESEGETSFRRSLYFRNTPNEKMLMLEVFDVADPNACYRRKESIVPHQSLAMMNSGLTQDSARLLASRLTAEVGADTLEFISTAFDTVLGRQPTSDETRRCEVFLRDHVERLTHSPPQMFAAGGAATQSPSTDPATRARENLVHVLFLHNDFVTIR